MNLNDALNKLTDSGEVKKEFLFGKMLELVVRNFPKVQISVKSYPRKVVLEVITLSHCDIVDSYECEQEHIAERCEILSCDIWTAVDGGPGVLCIHLMDNFGKNTYFYLHISVGGKLTELFQTPWSEDYYDDLTKCINITGNAITLPIVPEGSRVNYDIHSFAEDRSIEVETNENEPKLRYKAYLFHTVQGSILMACCRDWVIHILPPSDFTEYGDGNHDVANYAADFYVNDGHVVQVVIDNGKTGQEWQAYSVVHHIDLTGDISWVIGDEWKYAEHVKSVIYNPATGQWQFD